MCFRSSCEGRRSHSRGCPAFLPRRQQVTRLSNALFTFYTPGENVLVTYLVIVFKGGNALTNFGYDTERPDNPAEMVWSMIMIVLQLFMTAFVLGTPHRIRLPCLRPVRVCVCVCVCVAVAVAAAVAVAVAVSLCVPFSALPCPSTPSHAS